MRLIKIFCCFLFVFKFLTANSKELKYPVSEIPKELLLNSKAVIRNEKIEFEIQSPKEAIKQVEYAVTILNKNGIDASIYTQYYDKFSSIKNIKATIYDGDGQLVKRIKSIDIQDYSAISGYSIYDDNRVKFIDPEYRTVPYTIEYSFEIKYNGIISYPSWMPYRDYNISVEKSEFNVILPNNQNLRFEEKNLNNIFKKSDDGTNTIYSWEVINMPALIMEPYSEPLSEYLPIVLIAPSDFEIDNYPGNLETWQNFGKWILMLNEEVGNLSEEAQNKARELVKSADSEYEKIKILYEYMQNKTRYVSIQTGIGGWQPIDANTVDELSYGDCKALSNYMKALLDAIGIKSNYVLIKAGTNASPIISDFPSNQFNHVILNVPIQNDTIWLECTSQRLPVGYLGSFTDNREALLITENGGILTRTPFYSKNENLQSTKATVNISANSFSTALISIDYKGRYYDKMSRVLHSDANDQEKILKTYIGISNYNLDKYSLKEYKSRLPVINLNMDLNLKKYYTNMGDRLLVPLNVVNKIDNLPSKMENRISDIYISRGFSEVDSIAFNIPNGYFIEQVPEEVNLKSHYGNYNAFVKDEGNKLIYIRKYSINKGTYSSEDYNDFVAFFENIQKADNAKFIINKKDVSTVNKH